MELQGWASWLAKTQRSEVIDMIVVRETLHPERSDPLQVLKWCLLGGAEVVELRKKFEEDKKKIAELRAARRFKPY